MRRLLQAMLAVAAGGVAAALLSGGLFAGGPADEPERDDAHPEGDRIAPAPSGPSRGPALLDARVPGLTPRFDPAISDYVIRCARRTPRVRLIPRAGASVHLEGAAGWRSRPINERIPIAPGERFDFAVRSGERPRQAARYHVRCLPPRFPEWRFQSFAPGAARLYTATPDGRAVIFERNGVPVWWSTGTLAKNLQVLADGSLGWGHRFKDDFGVDSSAFYALQTPDGRRVRTMRTRGAPLDYHETHELRNGRFVLVTYKARSRPVDFSAWDGPEDASVVDAELQEVDRRGRVVWRWNSGDWIATKERQRRAFTDDEDFNQAAGARGAYDLVHLNSVDVRGDRLLISTRFTDAIHLIDRKTGEIVWKLGGSRTPESLRVVGDRRTQPLSSQHDARFGPDGTVTVFDNRTNVRQQPRVVRYRIDEQAGTATFVEHWLDPEAKISKCCGSGRLLADGSMVVGWGSDTATEFSPDREINWRLRYPGEHSYRVVPVEPGRITLPRLRRGMDRLAARHQRRN